MAPVNFQQVVAALFLPAQGPFFPGQAVEVSMDKLFLGLALPGFVFKPAHVTAKQGSCQQVAGGGGRLLEGRPETEAPAFPGRPGRGFFLPGELFPGG